MNPKCLPCLVGGTLCLGVALTLMGLFSLASHYNDGYEDTIERGLGTIVWLIPMAMSIYLFSLAARI